MRYSKVFHPNAGQYRRHLFPPLRMGVERDEMELFDEEVEQQDQPTFEQGFNEGLERGHSEGLIQGQEQGFAQGLKDGYQAGLKQGIEEGQKEGRDIYEIALGGLEKMQKSMSELSRHKLVEQQELIAELVGQVARRVVRAELTLNPQQVVTLVEEALTGLADDVEKVRIYINPEDKKRLEALGTTHLRDWPFEADASIAVGDCRISAAQMEIAVESEERVVQCMDNVKQSLEQVSD